MTNIAFTAAETVPEDVSEMPVCSIDLGFAKAQKTVGAIFHPDDGQPKEMTFCKGVSRVNDWLEEIVGKNEKQCVLVIEAPLSMAFAEDGNPCHRQIELRCNYHKGASIKNSKGWFYGAGANLSLASITFLTKLNVPKGLKVLLVEGFYCSLCTEKSVRKPLPGVHEKVAAHLLGRLLERKGESLQRPRAEAKKGTVELLPGMRHLIAGIPSILLRAELRMKEPEWDW